MQSVFTQTCTDYEYIVIDGGSTDGTVDIIRRHAARLAHWRSERDQGIYDAINKAIDLARGRWIYVLGADDRLRNCLHRLAPKFDDPAGVYYGDVWLIHRRRRFKGRYFTLKVMRRAICHQALFYPAAVFARRRYDLKYRLLADYHLLLETFNDPRFHWHYMRLIIADYNDGDGASTVAKDHAFERDKAEILRRNFPAPLFLLWSSWKLLRRVTKLKAPGGGLGEIK